MSIVLSEKIKQRVTLIVIHSCQLVRVYFYKSLSRCRIEGKPLSSQPILSYGLGKIIFKGHVVIGYYPSPAFLSSYAHIEARGINAVVTIGDGTKINNNFCAIAEHTSIVIGENCLIGANVEILDSDFHGLLVSERNHSKPGRARAVQIMDNVFIGSNARVMKGVTIGYGAVIANSAVVTKDVPALSVVAGNPAKVIKLLGNDADE